MRGKTKKFFFLRIKKVSGELHNGAKLPGRLITVRSTCTHNCSAASCVVAERRLCVSVSVSTCKCNHTIPLILTTASQWAK